ncbi:unnamed protein product [Symbiodinium sp. CCMP2592]|nr:unnamed protein product [Symbiodinium sp. CCMP2592]
MYLEVGDVPCPSVAASVRSPFECVCVCVCVCECVCLCQEVDPACRQLIVDHHKWLSSFTGHCSRLPCVFGDIMEQLDGTVDMSRGSFECKRRRVTAAALQRYQYCTTHAQPCCVDTPVMLDVSGLPCPDNSRANHGRLFEEGPSGKIYITWAAQHKRKQTPLLILENVRDMNMTAIAALLEDDYLVIPLKVSPTDVGHDGISRDRLYVFCSHRKTGRYLYDVHEAYACVSKKLRRYIQTRPRDYFVASDRDIHLDALRIAAQRRVQFVPESRLKKLLCFQHVRSLCCYPVQHVWVAQGADDLSYLLNSRELEQKEAYECLYRQRFGSNAEEDEDCCVYLGDNVRWTVTWSASSGRIPTLRRSSGRMWNNSRKRWMCPVEKLACHGYPVTKEAASVLGVPALPVLDPLRADSVCGNSMHFSNCALVLLCGLTCFGARLQRDSADLLDWSSLRGC